MKYERLMSLAVVLASFAVTPLLALQETKTKEVNSKKTENKDYIHQVRMLDGSSINGILQTASIKVKTNFGELEVPVKDIVSIVPGYRNHPKVKDDVLILIKELKSKEKRVYDRAVVALSKKGSQYLGLLQDQIKTFDAKKDKKALARLETIIEDFEIEIEEMGEAQRKNHVYLEQDRLVTKKFEIVGQILDTSFKFASKYGQLSVEFQDLRKVVLRKYSGDMGIIKKNFKITAEDSQNSFKDSGILVKLNDHIKITATGDIEISVWGYITGPEGNSNGMGMINNFPTGTMLARIGSTGEMIKIGSSHSFRAKKAGKLYLGTAFNARYTRHGTSGGYNVQVKVKPKSPE